MRIFIVLLALSAPLAAQTPPSILTCSRAAAGTPMTPWPNCVATSYKPAASGLVVATLRTGKAVWEPAAAIASTDSVFTNAPYNGTTSNWWPSSKFAWGQVSTSPVTTPGAVTGITISWSAPKPVAGATLAGYRIYAGSAVYTITNPATMRYTLPILPAGQYSMALTSFTTGGTESARTPAFLVTIPAGTQPLVQSNTVTCSPTT